VHKVCAVVSCRRVVCSDSDEPDLFTNVVNLAKVKIVATWCRCASIVDQDIACIEESLPDTETILRAVASHLQHCETLGSRE